jgi:hypothetical protein
MPRISLLVPILAAGCVDTRPAITGTQSFAVDLVSPALPGDIDHRLSADQRAVTINLTAYDADRQVDTSFSGQLQIYAQFLGTLTPTLDAVPLDTVEMTAGHAMAKVVNLPPVYGATTIWVDDGKNASPTYATGTSPALWYPDPHIVDLQKVPNEAALDALISSPLQNKQIRVDTSRYGAVGRLVVTAVFSQGYTVSDVQCADTDGRPPCVAGDYDHVVVFSFSAPTDQRGRLLQPGQIIDSFSGGITEFNGLTEIGFPATRSTSDEINPARIPKPVKLDRATWFAPLSDPNGIINFERNEAGLIELDDAAVCALDVDYERFKQWKLDPTGEGGDCSGKRNLINVVTAGVIADLDPAKLAGKKYSRVVGSLRPVITSGGPVWIIFPRTSADLVPAT